MPVQVVHLRPQPVWSTHWAFCRMQTCHVWHRANHGSSPISSSLLLPTVDHSNQRQDEVPSLSATGLSGVERDGEEPIRLLLWLMQDAHIGMLQGAQWVNQGGSPGWEWTAWTSVLARFILYLYMNTKCPSLVTLIFFWFYVLFVHVSLWCKVEADRAWVVRSESARKAFTTGHGTVRVQSPLS